MVWKIWRAIRGARPERRLVEQEQPGARHERPPDGEHLLLAAGERPGRLPAALPEHREERENALEVGGHAGPVAAGVGADRQVLLDGEAREDLAALGREAHAAGDELPGRAGRRPVAPRGGSRRRPGGTRPATALRVDDLPAPLDPTSVTISLGPYLEGDVVHGADRPVPDGQGADLEVAGAAAGGRIRRRAARSSVRQEMRHGRRGGEAQQGPHRVERGPARGGACAPRARRGTGRGRGGAGWSGG